MIARRCTPARVAALVALGSLAACLLNCSDGPAGSPSLDAAEVEPGVAPAVDERGRKPGRFRKVRSAAAPALDDEQREINARLQAIGYLSGSREAVAHGVTVHHRDEAWAGPNFYTSGHGPVAVLMDMDGVELHRWEYPFARAWPGRSRPPKVLDKEFWRRAYLFENGDLLAIFDGLGIIKLDADSRLIWASPLPAHHDLTVMDNGEIYVLSRVAHIVPRFRETAPILEDFITVLGADGREKRSVSLLEAFENSEYEQLLYETRSHRDDEWLQKKWRRGDIMHTNSVEVLDGRIAERVPAFRRGNVLVSLRVPNVVAVVDLEQEKVVWALRGEFKRQHDPRILANGNLLLFDNLGRPDKSSVIELDPSTGTTRWSYRGSATDPFFSKSCGTAQRLTNGNTLVTESDNGRAFEIDADGEIVWEFYNPEQAGERRQYIATLFEVVRLPPDFPLAWAHETGDLE